MARLFDGVSLLAPVAVLAAWFIPPPSLDESFQPKYLLVMIVLLLSSVWLFVENKVMSQRAA